MPDESHAKALCRQLQPFGVEAIAVDGHYEIHVDLVDRSPKQRITTALHAIDLWLLTAGLPSVQVHVDGNTYTIHAPTGPQAA